MKKLTRFLIGGAAVVAIMCAMWTSTGRADQWGCKTGASCNMYIGYGDCRYSASLNACTCKGETWVPVGNNIPWELQSWDCKEETIVPVN
jgi:hypothetical protein